jgi:hypothetical protein
MLYSIAALTALAGTTAAHFRLNTPTWRGDSFASPASQYTFPCAGINATTDSANRTAWPLSGGSVVFNGSHPWAYTYVNLALGSLGSTFNITLLEGFNQTGPGVFCIKDAGKMHLDAGLKAAGYSGLGDKRLDGLDASVQVVQLGERGSALYNVSRACAYRHLHSLTSPPFCSVRTSSSMPRPSCSRTTSARTARA